ncbi:MAG: polyketide synthase dehydratase domain-containing protein [Phycisphaerales bacterium]|jgi:3-hydroxyacyl-[acyl-carrier-protein] dehydratase|nr:polyketide synthase dehydratase domain-containing protein [Phycisphaerales bacterium]
MHFNLIDNVLELGDDHIVARKQVTSAEEYLADHFPGFPILPGVMMLETMVQAARHLIGASRPGAWVAGDVRAVKYGAMVRPGQSLRVAVSMAAPSEAGTIACRGTGVIEGGPGDGDTAISGRFTMRPPNNLRAAAQLQESETTCS